jgi:hypothetical protein
LRSGGLPSRLLLLALAAAVCWPGWRLAAGLPGWRRLAAGLVGGSWLATGGYDRAAGRCRCGLAGGPSFVGAATLVSPWWWSERAAGACCGAMVVPQDVLSLSWWRCCGGGRLLPCSRTTLGVMLSSESLHCVGGHDGGDLRASISLLGASWEALCSRHVGLLG